MPATGITKLGRLASHIRASHRISIIMAGRGGCADEPPLAQGYKDYEVCWGIEIQLPTSPQQSSPTMTVAAKLQSLSLLPFFSLLFAASAYAGIGPVTTLNISDADIAPDGFTRAAVVVNGMSPGPLITGNKVSCAMVYCSRILLNLPENRGIVSRSMSLTR